MDVRDDDYELLQYYRSEIKFESGLLNARVGALLASQSFLVIAYVTSLVGLRMDSHPLLILVLPTSLALLGLLLAIKARPGIVVASRVIVAWRRKQEELMGGAPALMERYHVTTDIPKGPLEPLRRGTRFAVQAPSIFLALWCGFAVLPMVLVVLR